MIDDISKIYPEPQNIYIQEDFPVLYSLEIKFSFYLVYRLNNANGITDFVYTKITPASLENLEKSKISFQSCFLSSETPIILEILNNRSGKEDVFEGYPYKEVKCYSNSTIPKEFLPPFGFCVKGDQDKENILLWMDFESEGLNVQKHRILEFAFLLTDSDGTFIKDPLHGYINHEDYFCDPKAFGIHGLTQEFLQENGVVPSTFFSLLNEYMKIIRPGPFDIIVAGQNVKDFDFKMLSVFCRKNKKDHLLKPVGRRTLDLESLSITFFPNRSISLSNTAKRMGYHQEMPHSALKDILLSLKIWKEYKKFMYLE